MMDYNAETLNIFLVFPIGMFEMGIANPQTSVKQKGKFTSVMLWKQP